MKNDLQQRENKKLEVWLEEHNAQVQAQFSRWLKRGLIAFGIIAVCVTVALIGFGLSLKNQNDLSNDIQQQRFDTLVQFCQDTNQRNNNVNKEIDKAIHDLPEEQQPRANERADPFRLIINAAVPYHENCTEEARNLVKGQ